MRIFLTVKPKAKENKIEKTGDNNFHVWVKEPPIQGRANQAVLRQVADYFKIPLARVKIISGFSSRQKVVEI